jgi:hypothetical protein
MTDKLAVIYLHTTSWVLLCPINLNVEVPKRSGKGLH